MAERSGQRRRAITLLATTFFLVAAASFHSSNDNDVATLTSGAARTSISLPAAPDTCSACALDGILLAQLSLALPVDRPAAVRPLVLSNPLSPFVSPRASVESRPPPSIA